jgi:serine/threonine-protein kinase
VALKFLLPELSANPSFEQMFLDEAALAARIRHPNVVQVVDLGEENEILYQVMEWVNGESLWAVMRAAAKEGRRAARGGREDYLPGVRGLHAAHELKDDEGHSIGLVHRDVTPQNILLTPEGLAKVVDFGVAKFAGRGVAQTQAGELKGKVPYMAPEHIKGRELDRRADVFSLGILFYQLVAGVHPFLGDNDQLTMVRISSATPAVPLRARVPTISEALSQVVATALEKSPDKRTKTALDLMHDIERAVPGASMASSNDLVAEFLRGILGDHIGARDAELREALEASICARRCRRKAGGGARSRPRPSRPRCRRLRPPARRRPPRSRRPRARRPPGSLCFPIWRPPPPPRTSLNRPGSGATRGRSWRPRRSGWSA